ncbi:hypothetical protein T4A_8350 [Trichinella pseudospiralis]|uniref:Uncharacterized protein n=1 Tax=Trichinella pseudospiralis TaxID=6337 RepID=A0A0V1DW81_TRIPS|nr:hypothetical protein T4A_8350 [Trichinella pseudospiralis]
MLITAYNDELLESRRKKLSQLTSYDAQKRDFTKKKYESLQQLLCLSTAIIHWWLIHQATHEEDGPHHTKIFMLRRTWIEALRFHWKSD